MKKYFFETYADIDVKISNVNFTKLTFIKWINMVLWPNKIQTLNFTFARLTPH